MMIADVISEAATEHEVYFLLTSYVEAVRHADLDQVLPHPLRGMPIRGVPDIESRLHWLTVELGRAAPATGAVNGELLREALSLFAAALSSLNRIQEMADPELRRATLPSPADTVYADQMAG